MSEKDQVQMAAYAAKARLAISHLVEPAKLAAMADCEVVTFHGVHEWINSRPAAVNARTDS